MHIILDFVLCWVYEWPVMQISNASFPHSAGHHPVLMTKKCLRPERVHEFRFSVINNNSKYISLHCLSWRRTQPYDIAERPIASDGGVSHPPFSSFDWGICWPITAESNIHERRRAARELQAWSAFKDKEIQDLKVQKLEADLSLKDKFMRLAYWIMFQIYFEYSWLKSSQASYLPASPAMVDQCFVFSQDLGLLLWGLLFGR